VLVIRIVHLLVLIVFVIRIVHLLVLIIFVNRIVLLLVLIVSKINLSYINVHCGSLRFNVGDNRNSSTNVGESFPHIIKQKILCFTGSHIQEFDLCLTQQLIMPSLI